MKKLSLILFTLVCTAMAANATWNFTDVTSTTLPGYSGIAGTVAWGDVDSDGDMDLFIGGLTEGQSALYLYTDSRFQESTSQYGLSNLTGVRTAKFVDYNSDGRLDLLCTNTETGITLLRQSSVNHRYQAVDIDAEHALSTPISSVVLCDVNRDGQLDLLLSNSQSPTGECITLLQEDESFGEQRGEGYDLPFDNNSKGAMCVVDFDRDGDQDYFFGGMPEITKTKLYSYDSRSGSYQDITREVSLPDDICPKGAVWADFNNDQRLDLFCPGMSVDCHLYLSRVPNQQIKFEDVCDQQGFLPNAARSEYAHAVDANMDGWMDIFITRTERPGCTLLMNHSGRWWENVAPQMGINNQNCTNYACAWCDYDSDGDMDLIIAQGESGVRLYRNDLSDTHEFINLTLCQWNRNTPIQGANVHFQFENDKQICSTWLTSCTPGGDAPTLQVCNSSMTKSDPEQVILTIEWPNGIHQAISGRDLSMWKNNVLNEPAPNPGVDPITLPSVNLAEVELSNSPNPFNPNTQISFTLSEAGRVNLSIYNVLGQEVAVLARDNFTAGTHRVEFNAGGLPSGLYLAKLSALGETAVHRLMLTK